jgi:hypothetical protein
VRATPNEVGQERRLPSLMTPGHDPEAFSHACPQMHSRAPICDAIGSDLVFSLKVCNDRYLLNRRAELGRSNQPYQLISSIDNVFASSIETLPRKSKWLAQ